MASLRALTEAHDRTWHLASAEWAVDMTQGTIAFTTPSAVATAPVQVIGTLAPDGMWLWGWDHPSVPAHLAEHAGLVRAYGDRHGIATLTRRIVPASEDDAWSFAAAACLLAGAQGAYRGPTGETLVFMTFGEVHLTGTGPPGDGEARRGAAHSGDERADRDGGRPAALPLAPTPHVPEPEAIGPADGLHTPATTDQLHGPEPHVTPDQVVGFVRDYMREMHPTYHIDADETHDPAARADLWDAQADLWDAQDAIRSRYWRRTDEFFVGAVRGNDRRYDLTIIRDWTAQRIAPRLWQVTWARHQPAETTYAGCVVMAFDDGLRVIDEIYETTVRSGTGPGEPAPA
jgi:hypothetical protein